MSARPTPFFGIVLNLRSSTDRFPRTLPAATITRCREFGTGSKTGPPRSAAVGLGHPTRFLPNPRAPFSAVRTPATGAWTDLSSGQIRPGSLLDCIRARHDGTARRHGTTARHDGTARRHGTTARHDGRKSKYAAPGLIWRRFRLPIRARRGSMARGSMARGSMARGSMARGSMARGSMARIRQRSAGA